MTPSVIDSVVNLLNKSLPVGQGRNLKNPEFVAEVIGVIDARASFQRIAQVRSVVSPGCIARFPVRSKNTNILFSESPTRISAKGPVLDSWCVPPSPMSVQIFPDWTTDLDPISALAITVAQERLWLALVNAAAGENETHFGHVAPHMTGNLGTDIEGGVFQLRAQVKTAGFNLHNYTNCFLGSELAKEALKLPLGIGGQTEVMRDYGYLGSYIIDGYHRVSLYSDYQRDPQSRVLSDHQMVHISDPLNHGFYADSGIKTFTEDDRIGVRNQIQMVQTSTLSSVLMSS